MLEVQREQGVGGGGDTGGKEGAKRTEKGRERAGEGEQGVSDQPFFRVTVQRVPDAECIAAAQVEPSSPLSAYAPATACPDEATKLLGTRPREVYCPIYLRGICARYLHMSCPRGCYGMSGTEIVPMAA
eukprot:910595-Rhodomonas_salina.4